MEGNGVCIFVLGKLSASLTSSVWKPLLQQPHTAAAGGVHVVEDVDAAADAEEISPSPEQPHEEPIMAGPCNLD